MLVKHARHGFEGWPWLAGVAVVATLLSGCAGAISQPSVATSGSYCDGRVSLPPETGFALGASPSSDPAVTGYRMYIGTEKGVYARSVDLGLDTHFSMELDPGIAYF